MDAGKFLFASAGVLFTATVGVVVVDPSDGLAAVALTIAGAVVVGAAIGEVVVAASHKRKGECPDGQSRD